MLIYAEQGRNTYTLKSQEYGLELTSLHTKDT